jgi:membrane protein DedA with SNARE-associated domain
MVLLGYYLGQYVPGVTKHIELVIAGVIFVSILPGIVGWWRERRVMPSVADLPPASP